MSRKIEVVYENGLLRPIEPLEAEEGKHLTVTLMDSEEDESVIEDYHGPVGEKDVPLEEIRQRLAKIPGSLAEHVIRQREDRV